MQRFKNILYVASGETSKSAALERAVSLAKRNQAQLTVVGVIQGFPCGLQRIKFIGPADFKEMIIQEQTEKLERLVASISQEGVQVTFKVLFGTPFLEIIREVLRNCYDLVMMNAEDKGRLKEMIFGSTEMHLMRKCPCPVWVTKPNQVKPYARILAAVDPDPDEAEKSPLNRKIMELATSLAYLEGSELHVVHVWNLYGEDILRTRRFGLPESEVDRILEETKKSHERGLNELLEQYPLENLKHQVHLLKGDAERLILDLAREMRAEIIVMGTLCRTGVYGLLIGNTAEKVLHHVGCSVLTVKPDGFVTPVRLP